MFLTGSQNTITNPHRTHQRSYNNILLSHLLLYVYASTWISRLNIMANNSSKFTELMKYHLKRAYFQLGNIITRCFNKIYTTSGSGISLFILRNSFYFYFEKRDSVFSTVILAPRENLSTIVEYFQPCSVSIRIVKLTAENLPSACQTDTR